MKFYRIANTRTGTYDIPKGPYHHAWEDEQQEDLSIRLSIAHDRNDRHPWDMHPDPIEEGLPLTGGSYCGFLKLARLSAWFDGWLREVHEAGYALFVYEVPWEDIEVGELQCVARLTRETPYEVRPILAGQD